MTVAVNDRTTGPLEMTGGETVISYDWKILSSADLAVWRSRGGAVTQLALTTDYTVSGVGSGAGGDVELQAAALAGDVFVVEGLRPSARTSDLVYDKAMPPATLNGEYDSLQIQVRELRRDIDRAIKLSRFETGAPGSELPEAVAGKSLGFNGDGDLDLIDGGGGGGGSMTGAEIVTAIDTELGGTTWQDGGGSGGGATNLGYTASPTNGIVTSDTGADATVPVANGTNAGLMAPAQHTKLAGIETGATADQSAGEIEAAYNGQVAAVTQVEAEAGTEAGIRRWSPQRVAQAIAALSGAAGDPISGRMLKFRRNLTGWQSTSSTSADLTVGSKSLTVGTGKSFEAGDVLKIHQTANSSNYALAQVTSYNSGTGALVCTFMVIVGSGTGITGWTINAAAEYRKPADLAYIESWAIGGGGGGETSASTFGGAGGACYTIKAAADLSASETVTVGAGGAVDNDGGDSVAFGATASGGKTTAIAPFVGDGGAASGGLINIPGEAGVTGGAMPAFGFSVKGHPGKGFGVGGGATTKPGLDGVVIVREHFGSAGSGSGGDGAQTIADNAVTYAKLQDVSATARALGRKTAGAGDAEELTLSELLDFVGSAAQGDLLYRGASGWTRLAAGTAGHFLKTGGAGANPSWDATGGGGSVATDTIWDAKGDLAGGTGSNTAARLAVGDDGTQLRADSTAATGLRWAGAHTPLIIPAFGLDTADIYGEHLAGATAALTLTANRFYLHPIVFGDCNQLDEVAIRVSTAVAATSIRIGLYADAGGKPGALITEFTSGTQIDSSSTGKKALTSLARVLVPGRLYWLGLISDGAPAVFGSNAGTIAAVGVNLGASSVGQAHQTHTYFSSTYGAMSGIASGDLSSTTMSKVAATSRPVIGWKTSRV